MLLDENDLLAWTEDGWLAIGKIGEHWNDASVSLLGGATAQQIWEDYPDKRKILNSEGFFTAVEFVEEF